MYYKKKKQEQEVVGLTQEPCVSEAEDVENEETQRRELDTNLNRTPTRTPEESLEIAGPMVASPPENSGSNN